MNEAVELGREMYSRMIVLKGRLTVSKWRAFLNDCTKSMGMEAAGKAAHWAYPTHGGKGGKGHTVVQPITESFLALDTWPDHDGAYLLIASCKRFAISRVTETAILFGLDVDGCSPPVTMRLK